MLRPTSTAVGPPAAAGVVPVGHAGVMPEGDTVHRAATKLHRALQGTTLTASQLRWPSLAANDLTGWATLEVVSRGKHLLHRFDSGWTLRSHLRMEGHWQVRDTRPGARPVRQRGRSHELRVKLSADGVEALGWRLGMLDLVRTDGEDRLLGHLGPDILGTDWEADLAVTNLLATPERPVAEALLDQTALAGIGTMWASDVLFMTRIHPWSPTSEVGAEALTGVLERARTSMTRACETPITSSTGSQRRGEETWVHARSGQPCRRCRTTVRVAMAGRAPNARTIFYCPTCQGGVAAVDDGRPQSPLGAGTRRTAPGRRNGYRT